MAKACLCGLRSWIMCTMYGNHMHSKQVLKRKSKISKAQSHNPAMHIARTKVKKKASILRTSMCMSVCECAYIMIALLYSTNEPCHFSHSFSLPLLPFFFFLPVYMWYPIAGPSPIAVHGPISGPKDRYRAVDRYRARSYRSKRLELRFAVAVHSPIVVHGPITVQPEFFKFPRRNVPLGICLSTDFSAFLQFQARNVRIDISLSTDFRAFSRTKESLARATWHFRMVRSLVFLFFFVRYRALSFQKEEGQGLARNSLF